MNLNDYKVVNCHGTPLEKYPFADEIQFCLSHIREGDTVIDVGANAAYYSLPFSKAVGAAGRIYAFEPSEKYRHYFEVNMKQCPYVEQGAWQLIPQAVGREVGKARLVHSPGQTASTAGLYTDGGADNSPDTTVNKKLAKMMEKRVWIYGTGGAAKALVDKIGRCGIFSFIDSFRKTGETFCDTRVVNIADVPPDTPLPVLITGAFRWTMEANLKARGITNYLHILSPNESGGVLVETVPQTTIDDFCDRKAMPQIHFIKIDTDGNEADVLEGAERVLWVWKPKIFCEVNVLHDAARRIFYILNKHGYKIRTWPDMEEVDGEEGLDTKTNLKWFFSKNAEGMNIYAEVAK